MAGQDGITKILQAGVIAIAAGAVAAVWALTSDEGQAQTALTTPTAVLEGVGLQSAGSTRLLPATVAQQSASTTSSPLAASSTAVATATATSQTPAPLNPASTIISPPNASATAATSQANAVSPTAAVPTPSAPNSGFPATANTAPQDISAAPALALGQASGTSIAFMAATSGEKYRGFQVHARYLASPGLTQVELTADAAGSVLFPTDADRFCIIATPPGQPDGRIFGCVMLGPSGSNATGRLATLTVTAEGDGCVAVSLVPEQRPGLGSFTLGMANASQANRVDVAPRFVLIGTGRLSDCPAAALQ